MQYAASAAFAVVSIVCSTKAWVGWGYGAGATNKATHMLLDYNVSTQSWNNAHQQTSLPFRTIETRSTIVLLLLWPTSITCITIQKYQEGLAAFFLINFPPLLSLASQWTAHASMHKQPRVQFVTIFFHPPSCSYL